VQCALYTVKSQNKINTRNRASRFRVFAVARGRNAGCIPRYHWGLSGVWLSEPLAHARQTAFVARGHLLD
jgi:hypothetical protein